MASAVNENQGVLQANRPLAEIIYAARGVVRPEDLTWANFDPERVLTMTEYLGEIGVRMTDTPRESATRDSALHIYGRDFVQAEPINLAKGLYFPYEVSRVRPKKLVVRVTNRDRDLARGIFPGTLPFSTGVAVSEELYEAIVQDAAHYSNKIANRTEKANSSDPAVIEQNEDLGGESVLYAQINKHELLETHDQDLLIERAKLSAVQKSLDPNLSAQPKRIKNLEEYRLAAVTSIQAMARIACKGLGYGTNQTQNTLNAIASNMHRSPDAARHMLTYSHMALRYNDEVRGKIEQSIYGIIGEIGLHSTHAINNIDREYKTK